MKDEKSTARSLQSADTERRNAADVEDGQAAAERRWSRQPEREREYAF